MYSLSAFISLPFRTKHGLRVIYVFVRDFWMYNYDNRRYSGLLKEIINSVTVLELMKFRFLDNFLGLAHYANELHISDYSQYTLGKFQ